LFECKRCTREINLEEAHLLFNDMYCRACIIVIETSPEYEYVRKNILGMIPQIEN